MATLSPGVYEIPILIGGPDSVKTVSLQSAAGQVRLDAQAAVTRYKTEEEQTSALLPAATAAWKAADAARSKAEADLRVARKEYEVTRGLVAQIGRYGFVAHMSDRDPEVQVISGRLEQAMLTTTYTATATDAALSKNTAKAKALKAARARSTAAREAASQKRQALDTLRKRLAEATSQRQRSEQIVAALSLDALQTPAVATTPAVPGTTELPKGPDIALSNLVNSGGATTFPIAGEWDFIDSWGYPRSGGRTHKGADIFANKGTPVVALEDAVVKTGSNSLGGQVLYVFGRSGNRYYYAHLSAFAPNIENAQVKAGQVIGFVGNSGNAVDTPPHLHFEVRVPQLLADINPYPMLQTLSKAVDAARLQGAHATAPASVLATLDVAAARQLWDLDRVNHSTAAALDALTIIGLVNSGRVSATILGMVPPATYAAAKPKIDTKFASQIPASPGPALPAPLPPVVMAPTMRPGIKSLPLTSASIAAVQASLSAPTTTG